MLSKDEKSTVGGCLKPDVPKLMRKYQFKELIGSGAEGAVFKAYDTEENRLVAVKYVRLAI